MTTSQRLRVFIAILIPLVGITLRARPAAAVTSFANIQFTNNTPCDINLSLDQPNSNGVSLSVGGQWDPPPPLTAAKNGGTVSWQTDSDGQGFGLHGTGGEVMLTLAGGGALPGGQTFVDAQELTLNWSLPWDYFNGGVPPFQPNVSAKVSPDVNGNSVYSVASGIVGCGGDGNNTCDYQYILNFTGDTSTSPPLDCSDFKQDSGSLNLPFFAPSPVNGVPGGLTGYFDSTHDAEYEFYVDQSGNIDALSCGSGGCWASQVVAPAGMFLFGSSLVSYFDGTNGHLFFETMGFDVIELKGNPPSINGTVTDVTSAAGGAPWATYASYTDQNGNAIGGLVAQCNLTGFWDGQNDHIFYCDQGNNIHETYFDTRWWDHVVAPASALSYPPLGTIRSVWDGTNEHVYYPTGFYNSQESGIETVAMGETSFPGNWTPSTFISSSEILDSNFTAMTFSQGYDWILGGFSDGQLGWYFQYPSESGSFASYGDPNYMPNSPTVAFEDNGGLRLLYIGSDSHVYMGYSGATDLSAGPGNNGALAGSTIPAGGSNLSPLSGFYDGTNDHAFYVDTGGNVEEMYWGAPNGSVTAHIIGGDGQALPTGLISNYQR